MDLKTIDPATVKPSVELDALIAGEWMGWEPAETWVGWKPQDDGGREELGRVRLSTEWSPSTNPAHAGEARRKETYHEVTHGRYEVCVSIGGKTETEGYAEVAYVETDNDKARAEALATCRAIVAAMKAKEE